MKKVKEPSLFRKLIDIYHEQAIRRKALRLLQQQAWSLDFLSLLLVRASKLADKGLSITIQDKMGTSFTLTYDAAKDSAAIQNFDDSIFNHLDDDVAIQNFVSHISRG